MILLDERSNENSLLSVASTINQLDEILLSGKQITCIYHKGKYIFTGRERPNNLFQKLLSAIWRLYSDRILIAGTRQLLHDCNEAINTVDQYDQFKRKFREKVSKISIAVGIKMHGIWAQALIENMEGVWKVYGIVNDEADKVFHQKKPFPLFLNDREKVNEKSLVCREYAQLAIVLKKDWLTYQFSSLQISVKVYWRGQLLGSLESKIDSFSKCLFLENVPRKEQLLVSCQLGDTKQEYRIQCNYLSNKLVLTEKNSQMERVPLPTPYPELELEKCIKVNSVEYCPENPKKDAVTQLEVFNKYNFPLTVSFQLKHLDGKYLGQKANVMTAFVPPGQKFFTIGTEMGQCNTYPFSIINNSSYYISGIIARMHR